MALTVTAAWKAAMLVAEPRVRFLVTIYDGTNTWKSVSGSMDAGSDLAGTVEGVGDVAPVGISRNPLTRQTQIGEVFVDFHDAYLRPLIIANRLKGQEVTIEVGAAELDEADFAPAFSGAFDRWDPIGGHTIRASVIDWMQDPALYKINGGWFGKHPLEVLYDGVGQGMLEQAGIAAARIDTTSFDESQSEYENISHFLVGRGGTKWNPIMPPTDALEAINEVAQLMNGAIYTTETGAVTFKLYDPDAAALADWDKDTIIPGTFKQVELDENIRNRIDFDVLTVGAEDGSIKNQNFQMNDSVSQSAHKLPGTTKRILTHPIRTNWLGAVSCFAEDMTAIQTTLSLFWEETYNFSGNSANAHQQLSVSPLRVAYFLLDSWDVPEIQNREIVKATAATRNTTKSKTYFYTRDPNTGAQNQQAYTKDIEYTISRAQLGTSASIHSGIQSGRGKYTYVYDITPLVYLGQALLERFSLGCPIIELETLATEYEYQIGDMVNVTWPEFVAYGLDGLDGDKFEIVGKEPHWLEGRPSIKWTLAMATDETPTFIMELLQTGSRYGEFRDRAYRSDVGSSFVDNFFRFTSGGGLSLTMNAGGRVANSGGSFEVLEDQTLDDLPASKDNYLIMDGETHIMRLESETLGDPAPRLNTTETLLAKVITDALSIASIVDTPLQTTKPTSPLQSDDSEQLGWTLNSNPTFRFTRR